MDQEYEHVSFFKVQIQCLHELIYRNKVMGRLFQEDWSRYIATFHNFLEKYLPRAFVFLPISI